MSNKDFHNITRGRIHAKDFADKAESINPLIYIAVIAFLIFIAKVAA